MAEKLSPNDIAQAAAQGVAIALNARKLKSGAIHEEFTTPFHRIICGIPQYMFEVGISQNADGSVAVSKAQQIQEQ